VFALLAAGVLMSNLDTFVANVALPQIESHFHQSSLGPVSWVLNAYAVIFAAGLVPAGNLADRYGARRIYLAGIAVFAASSLACALAPGVWWLVGFRVTQATGAALLIPASLGLTLAAAPPDKRMLYVRGWAALGALGAALGPAIGGLLTDASWRWVFLINVPIGAAVLAAGAALLPRPAAKKASARIDAAGALLLSAGIGAVALGVVQSPAWGWSSGRVIGCLAGGMIVLAGFAVRSARHPSPVLPVPLLRVPGFTPASLCSLLFAVPFAASLLSIVVWAEQVWHWSPLATGFAVAPGPLVVPAFGLLVGPALLKRVGSGLVATAGSAIFAGGIAWWIAAMHAHADYLHMFGGMLLIGVGVGLTMPTLIATAVASVPPASFSTGSAVVTMARQIGSVLGVAIVVAILDTASHARNPVVVLDRGWWFTAATAGLAALASLTLIRTRTPTPAVTARGTSQRGVEHLTDAAALPTDRTGPASPARGGASAGAG
jgi:EmrB/QacA subfamily drug resistance transporter